MTDQIYRDFIEVTDSSCLGKNYLPYPPRVWYRSESPCYDFITEKTVYVEYLKRVIPTSELGEVISMIRKGNVLQYPANRSGNLKNKFSKIAKGFWKRKKAWASQTNTFTDHNVNKLERVNSTIIANNPNNEFFFPECYLQQKKITTKSFPKPGVRPVVNYPNIPQSTQNKSITGPVAYPVAPTPPKNPEKLNPSIIDGGNLKSCTQEDICSGAVLYSLEDITCNPTSDSNVPGPIINLCYPKNIQVTIPRQRTTYVSNSTKWPINGITNIPAYNSNPELSQRQNIGIFLNNFNKLQG